jgi:hypothetical protein
LSVKISDQAELQLFGHEFRRTEVEMGVDAAGIAGRSIDEISGYPERRREFIAGFLVEVGVADAAVDGAMAEA